MLHHRQKFLLRRTLATTFTFRNALCTSRSIGAWHHHHHHQGLLKSTITTTCASNHHVLLPQLRWPCRPTVRQFHATVSDRNKRNDVGHGRGLKEDERRPDISKLIDEKLIRNVGIIAHIGTYHDIATQCNAMQSPVLMFCVTRKLTHTHTHTKKTL